MLEDQQSATGKLRAFAFKLSRSKKDIVLDDPKDSVRSTFLDWIQIVRTKQPAPHSKECPIPGSKVNETLEPFTVKTVLLKLPPALFDKLAPELRDGRQIPLRTVMFAQGINEFQTMQNTLGTNALQKELNKESVLMLHQYYRQWTETMTDFAMQLQRRLAGITDDAPGTDHGRSDSTGSADQKEANSAETNGQITIVCPEGISAGQQVTIKLQSGHSYMVTIPAGIRSGDEFAVNFSSTSGDENDTSDANGSNEESDSATLPPANSSTDAADAVDPSNGTTPAHGTSETTSEPSAPQDVGGTNTEIDANVGDNQQTKPEQSVAPVSEDPQPANVQSDTQQADAQPADAQPAQDQSADPQPSDPGLPQPQVSGETGTDTETIVEESNGQDAAETHHEDEVTQTASDSNATGGFASSIDELTEGLSESPSRRATVHAISTMIQTLLKKVHIALRSCSPFVQHFQTELLCFACERHGS